MDNDNKMQASVGKKVVKCKMVNDSDYSEGIVFVFEDGSRLFVVSARDGDHDTLDIDWLPQ